jgi:hypothetical protein
MSYFSIALTRVAERTNVRQADIVRTTGIPRSQVSRIFTGDQKHITQTDLTALLNCFREPRDRAEIIAARCKDVCIGPGAELVEIAIKGPAPASAKATKQSEFPHVELSHDTERAFAWLRSQCPFNPDLEKHLLGYARLTGMK